jgi:hypothetical protein
LLRRLGLLRFLLFFSGLRAALLAFPRFFFALLCFFPCLGFFSCLRSLQLLLARAVLVARLGARG